MPITAVTGLPGHGKTLYTISRWKQIGEKEGRPIFYSGIKGLALAWQEWEVEKWQELPPGAIFIIDEAQFRLKVHGRGQLPDWIEQLSVHRHGGLDLVLITQNPMMLDPFVRRLVDRHFHVSRKFGLQRAVVHEFPTGINDNVAKVRAGSIRHDWKYPKEAFAWYKSAELHTVQKRIPVKIWLGLAAAICALGLIGFSAYRMQPKEVAGMASSSSPSSFDQAGSKPGFPGAVSAAPGRDPRQVMTPAEYVDAYTPRIEGLAHTAPAFDGVTAPQQAPYPAACIASAKRCQCYTQQGTRLDMREPLCRQIADGGFFVAWAPTGERVQAPGAPQATQTAIPQGQGAGHASLSPQPPQFVAQAVDDDAGSLPRRIRRVAQ